MSLISKPSLMKRTSSIITGIALLALGIGWALEIAGLINISYDGWWTFFIIIPCFAALFGSGQKSVPLVGLGVGILLLLATRGIIVWDDLWKYIVCIVAVIWGFSLIFCGKSCFDSNRSNCNSVDGLKQIEQNGRQIRQVNVSFGKQVYDFAGQQFEGIDVKTSFGFTALDLRYADILDGAVVNVECSFGGMEIRVGRDICVRSTVKTAFAGVECQCNTQPGETVKTLYVKGECSFGGIEIK